MSITSVRVNLLCLLGAIVGVVAIHSTWVDISSVFGYPSYDPWTAIHRLTIGPPYPWDSVLILSLSVFFVGVVISVVTPLGGFVQAAGGLLFFGYFFPELDSWPPYFEDRIALGFGPFLGFLSASIIITSIFMPTGIGYSKRLGLPDGVLTIRLLWEPKEPFSFKPLSDRWHVAQVFAFVSSFAGAWAIIYGVKAPGLTTLQNISDREAAYSILVVAGVILLILGIATLLIVILRRGQLAFARDESDSVK